jgi:anti-sigma regulatory factor (Ser/Thr protein kinase)
MTASNAAGLDEGLHAVALYDSAEGLCARAVPYLRKGLERAEAVVAVTSAGVEQVLRSALGGDAERVHWQGVEVSYRRLGAMFEGFRQFLAEQRAVGAAMRLLTQGGGDGAPERVAGYLRFEAMANEVYRPYGYRWACLYDQNAHPAEILRQAREVHPRVLEPGGRTVPSAEYVPPGDFVARGGPPTPIPPNRVELDARLTGPSQLRALRRLLSAWTASSGIDGDDADAVLHAVGEAVTNVLQHRNLQHRDLQHRTVQDGGPPVRVRAWRSGGTARVRVDASDAAPIPATTGYHRPNTAQDHNAGLWIARQLADIITTHTGQAGTTVELQFPLTPQPAH